MNETCYIFHLSRSSVLSPRGVKFGVRGVITHGVRDGIRVGPGIWGGVTVGIVGGGRAESEAVFWGLLASLGPGPGLGPGLGPESEPCSRGTGSCNAGVAVVVVATAHAVGSLLGDLYVSGDVGTDGTLGID